MNVVVPNVVVPSITTPKLQHTATARAIATATVTVTGANWTASLLKDPLWLPPITPDQPLPCVLLWCLLCPCIVLFFFLLYVKWKSSK